MKHPTQQPWACALALAALLTTTSAWADDTSVPGNLTVTGELFVAGNTDLAGNALSFGTRSDSLSGLSMTYVDGAAPSINFNASRANAAWLWASNAGTPQFKITGSNQLLLYDPSATPAAPGITLDPAGPSTFANSIVANGADNRLPNQTATGPDSIMTKSMADGSYMNSSALGDDNTWTAPQTFASGIDVSSGTLTVDNGAISSGSGNPLLLQAGGTTAMAVGASGNVGIGLTAPAYRLEVSGTTDVARFSSTGSWLGLLLTRSDGQTWAFISGNNGNTDDFGIEDRTAGRTGTQAPFVIAHANGNVGIGSTAPRGALEIQRSAKGALGPVLVLTNSGGQANASSAIDYYTYAGGSAVPGVRAQAVDDGHYSADWVLSSKKQSADANPLIERLRVASTGSVTIGTTAYPASLSVSGNTTLVGTVTAKAKLRVAASGDLPMGEFTADGGLGNPAN